MFFKPIIPVRTSSSRFPRKIMQTILGKVTAIEYLLVRLASVRELGKPILALSSDDWDSRDFEYLNVLAKLGLCQLEQPQVPVKDVLGRVSAICRMHNWTNTAVVDITSDCPLVCIKQLKQMVDDYFEKQGETESPLFLSNVLTRTWPDGFDIQIYPAKKLLDIDGLLPKDNPHRSHLGWNIVNYSRFLDLFGNPVQFINYPAPLEYVQPELGLTLDTKKDLKTIRNILKIVENPWQATAQDFCMVAKNPGVVKNKSVKRNLPGSGK